MGKPAVNGMGVYKFTDDDGLGYFLKGQLRFSNLNRYRVLEAAFDDDKIGDRDEATGENLLNLEVRGDEQSKAHDDLARMGLGISGPGTVRLRDAKLINITQGYVLCLAHGAFDRLVPELTKPSAIGVYHRCVRLNGLVPFLHELCDGVLFEGRPLGETFCVNCEIVTYIPRETNVYEETQQLAVGDPFFKDIKYEGQSELRIFLDPKRAVNLEHICVQIERPERYFTEVTLDVPPAPSTMPKVSRDDALLRFTEVVDELEKLCETSLAYSFDSGLTGDAYLVEERKLVATAAPLKQQLAYHWWFIRNDCRQDKVDLAVTRKTMPIRSVVKICRDYLKSTHAVIA